MTMTRAALRKRMVVVQRESESEESSVDEEEEDDDDDVVEEAPDDEEDYKASDEEDEDENEEEPEVEDEDEREVKVARKSKGRITISLKGQRFCKVCKAKDHQAGFVGSVYLDCPNKPCYLCKKPDCDDEEMEFVIYDDNDIVEKLEEPVAISRVRASALAKGSGGRKCRVTLDGARAKLDRVKASREKYLTKRKLESFLSDQVDAELQEQRKVVKLKKFSVEKARAMLEAVKIKKELAKPNINRHLNVFRTSPFARTSRTGSEANGIDEEVSHEGVWVRHAKVKLEAAREKKLKSSRKRNCGSKKRNVQRKSSSEISCMDRNDQGDVPDTMNAPDGVKAAKKASVKGKQKIATKQKAVKVSERIANSRLRMQQGLVALNVKAEIGSKMIEPRRNKRNKPEESNPKICTDLSRATRETEATTSERDMDSSPAMSLDFTSSAELTPPPKRRKKQQMLVDINLPGARLSSGVECVPPVSPYGLIQEHLYQDPWKVLVACMLLNKTGGRQMHKVIWDFFELCPNAERCVSTETEKIGHVIHSLGLQNKRAKTLQYFSEDYLGTTWTNVTQLHGIGEYARDAYAIFCEGRWQDVQPNDIVLNKYWQWVNDTQGLGYGYSQIE